MHFYALCVYILSNIAVYYTFLEGGFKCSCGNCHNSGINRKKKRIKKAPGSSGRFCAAGAVVQCPMQLLTQLMKFSVEPPVRSAIVWPWPQTVSKSTDVTP